MRTGWTNGKPFQVTSKHTKIGYWGGSPDGRMRRGLCGKKFSVDDTARWQYTNDTSGAGGNPFVCVSCDGSKEKIVSRIKEIYALHKSLKYCIGGRDMTGDRQGGG